MKKILAIIAVAVLFSGNVFAKGSGDMGAMAGDYAFGGSTTVEPIITAAAETIQEKYPDVYISYDAQGSSVGVKGVISGTYSLGAASRDLKDSEIADGVKATAIALDGVAVVVNKGVPLDNISLDDLTKIYTGEIKNWKQLGGPDKEIVVINRDEASGTRDCFGEFTVKKVKKDFVGSAVIVTSNGDMVSKVGSIPYAIGYCGLGYLGQDPGTKAVSVNNIKASESTIKNGTYPISRKLYVVHKGDLKEGTFEYTFVQFLLSSEGQAIVAEEKFIRLK